MQTEQDQIAQLRRELAEARASIMKVCEERDDLQASFDLRWKADMRAIERWRGGDPAKALKMPDHADLCMWLMEQLESTKPPEKVWWDDLQSQLTTERERAERAESALKLIGDVLGEKVPVAAQAAVDKITALTQERDEPRAACMATVQEWDALAGMRFHQWVGRQQGGSPSEAGSYEWVRYCQVCGMEDTCEDPLPPCPGSTPEAVTQIEQLKRERDQALLERDGMEAGAAVLRETMLELQSLTGNHRLGALERHHYVIGNKGFKCFGRQKLRD